MSRTRKRLKGQVLLRTGGKGGDETHKCFEKIQEQLLCVVFYTVPSPHKNGQVDLIGLHSSGCC